MIECSLKDFEDRGSKRIDEPCKGMRIAAEMTTRSAIGNTELNRRVDGRIDSVGEHYATIIQDEGPWAIICLHDYISSDGTRVTTTALFEVEAPNQAPILVQ